MSVVSRRGRTLRSTKGEAAAEILRKDFTAADITVWLLDMSFYDSILSFAQRAREQLNADIIKLKLAKNPSSVHEEIVQVNYLSTMLLALLMLPVPRQKSAGRSTPGRLAISNASRLLGTKFPKRNRFPLPLSLDGAADFDATKPCSASKLLAQLLL